MLELKIAFRYSLSQSLDRLSRQMNTNHSKRMITNSSGHGNKISVEVRAPENVGDIVFLIGDGQFASICSTPE